MHICDLTLETQHRGRYLVVRAFGEPNRVIAIQNAVEDEFGDVDRLAIYNLLPTVKPGDILPPGAIVAVKEPFYKRTADGGLFVRVDHPSDVVLLRPGNQLIPPRLAPPQEIESDLTDPSVAVLDLKEQGNALFKRGKWQQADDFYSDAIAAAHLAAVDDDLVRTLHRNRAAARLRLGRYEQTIADALAAMVPTETEPASEAAKNANIMALYRAGRAAYEMGSFFEAKKHFKAAHELDARRREVDAELGRTRKRLAEQEDGAYDFSAMAASATKRHTHLDHASFLKNTRIAPAGSRGRGLFATKALKPGDVIFVEKAFHTAYFVDEGDISLLLNSNSNRVSMGTHALCLYGLTDKILWNPTLANRYLDLHDGGKFGSSKKATVVDGKVAVDTFRVQCIAELNAFECPRVKSSDREETIGEDGDGSPSSGSGIWLQASYANHSCLPNGMRAFIGDMMVVRASRSIQAGEEIFMRYTDPGQPFSKRQKRMSDQYGFACGCDLCQAEQKVPKSVMEKHARLRKKIVEFRAANHLTSSNFRTVPRAKRTEAKMLLQQIRETYPQAIFDRLPRLDCTEIGLWNGRAGTEEAKVGLNTFLGVLRDTGYSVTVKDGHVEVDREFALPMEITVHSALYASQALAAMGNGSAANTLKDLAKDVYITRCGTMAGFEAKFG